MSIVGYFAWQNVNGKASPEKFGIERIGMNIEATRYFKKRAIGEPVPLDETEWKLSLKDLAAKYPAKFRFKG
jgi:hypothetical protein